ncbi:hypothetical protein Tco_0773534 [Tanacetum coccineum]|uniref:Uncharacterized protein n=1 Tax=Tanacetum coccineum TaxID=301880 RepID=A0ABQ4ZL07_9ASTR
MIQNMDSIEQCIVERARHEQELQNSRIVSDNGNVQGLENQSNTSGDESSRSRNECNDKSNSGDDTDISPSYETKLMVEHTPKNVVECEDERVALANLKLDIDENKKIQTQLKKANASLTQELTECKSILAETSRTLGESNSVMDTCLVALQNKQTEFEREIVDQAWVKHSKDHLNLRAPTAHDMQILIKTCLMPLALKTQNDSFALVHELKQNAS